MDREQERLNAAKEKHGGTSIWNSAPCLHRLQTPLTNCIMKIDIYGFGGQEK